MKLGIGAPLLALSLTGCPREATSPRHLARGAVLAVAEAVSAADQLCAARAKARHAAGQVDAALSLGRTCAKAYDVARKALLTAGHAVDAWGAASSSRNVSCAVAEAGRGLRTLTEAVTGAGGELPPEVLDGVQAAAWLAGEGCR